MQMCGICRGHSTSRFSHSLCDSVWVIHERVTASFFISVMWHTCVACFGGIIPGIVGTLKEVLANTLQHATTCCNTQSWASYQASLVPWKRRWRVSLPSIIKSRCVRIHSIQYAFTDICRRIHVCGYRVNLWRREPRFCVCVTGCESEWESKCLYTYIWFVNGCTAHCSSWYLWVRWACVCIYNVCVSVYIYMYTTQCVCVCE